VHVGGTPSSCPLRAVRETDRPSAVGSRVPPERARLGSGWLLRGEGVTPPVCPICSQDRDLELDAVTGRLLCYRPTCMYTRALQRRTERS
jgi:hypothetical protein